MKNLIFSTFILLCFSTQYIVFAQIICDTNATCPNDYTCCKDTSGSWACCPTPNATCCSDHIHCCPQNAPLCDLTHQACLPTSQDTSFSLPLLKKEATIEIKEKETQERETQIDEEFQFSFSSHSQSSQCGNGASCSSGSTCCKQSNGLWGCCNSAGATCCLGGVFCCPPAYPVCDLHNQQCLEAGLRNGIPLMKKNLTIEDAMIEELLSKIDYSIHQNNHDLNIYQDQNQDQDQDQLTSNQINQADENTSISEPAIQRCDAVSSCPDDSTCCKSPTGSWACCATVGATCCSDMIHCCPNNFPVCDIPNGQCLPTSENNVNATSIPLVTKSPAQIMN